MQARFNPPPGWPPVPPGWAPPPGWVPPLGWPPAPPGWQWWIPDQWGTAPRSAARGWVVGGCALLALAPFVTWANVVLLGSLNLFQIYTASGDPAVLPWLIVLAAVVAGVLMLARTPGARVVAIVIGFVAGGLGTLLGIGVAHGVNEAGGFASLGIGPFLAFAGALTMIIAGFLAR